MHDAPTLRRLVPGDDALALRVARDVHERSDVDPAAIAAFLTDPLCLWVVSLDDDEPLGAALGHVLRRPHSLRADALLYEVDVRAPWRRRGVGRRLVESFVAAARGAGAAEVWVPTTRSDAAALALYLRCGFTPLHADDTLLARAT